MKVITTNLLNRFWKNGVKPVKDDVDKINSNKLLSLSDIDLVTESGFFVDALAVKELNSKIDTKLDESGRLISLAEFGTYWQANTNIQLTDYIKNYKEIVIQTGWNASSNAGLYYHKFPVGDSSYTAQVPCYGQGQTIFMSVTIDSTLNYINIVYSNFTSSNARAIRCVFGIK